MRGKAWIGISEGKGMERYGEEWIGISEERVMEREGET